MSKCVVRMEMPSNCWACPFGLDGYIWDENYARSHHVRFCSQHSDEEFHVLETDTIDRPWFCDSFICSLPEGHGRLVDADALEKDVSDALVYGLKEIPSEEGKQIFHVLMQEVLDNVKKRKTIVPAEAERGET